MRMKPRSHSDVRRLRAGDGRGETAKPGSVGRWREEAGKRGGNGGKKGRVFRAAHVAPKDLLNLTRRLCFE